jgi:hypothetical protein
MGKYYHNAVKVNNGLVLDGQTPIDDRFVFESIKDLFIDPASPQLCELHTNAYRGLTVACMCDETGAETGKVYILTLVDDTPYTKGYEALVNASNYTTFWHSEKTYEIASDLADNDKVVGYYGDATGLTAEQLQTMSVSEILSKVLFEYCAPAKVSDPKLTITYKSNSAYRSAVEVGTALPKSSEMNNTFVADVWKWQSQYASQFSHAAKGVDQVLCSTNGAVTFYLRKDGDDSELDSLTTKVVEGSTGNGVVVAKKPYARTAVAKDSRESAVNPTTGEYYHRGASGTAESGTLAITGAWKPWANSGSSYTSASSAWADKNKAVSGYTADGHVGVNSLFDAATETFYVRFPAATTDAQPFYVWCPNSYTINNVKAANEAVQNVFDQEWNYTAMGTEEFTNSLGITGTFKKYSIAKPAGGGLLSVAVTFDRN